MSLTSIFDTVLSFCDEYGIKPVTVSISPEGESAYVCLLVHRPSEVGGALYWETDADTGFTTARIVFDGINFVVDSVQDW